MLRPDLVADPTRRLRFQREAEITAALEHPNIVPVYEVGEDGPHVYLAMRLVMGQTLGQLAGKLTPIAAATIAAQIAHGLHAAHEVGVVHRDVKPANIMVDGERAFLVDFGLARAEIDLSLTRSGQAPGTLPYMAPEQLRGGPDALDPRVDVYGLGAALYHAITGEPPFPGETSIALIRSIMTRDPARLANTPRDLAIIVQRALEKEPRHRFTSAHEMAEDLERFVRGEPIRSQPASPWQRLRKLAGRHPVSATILGLAATTILVLAVMLWNRTATLQRDYTAAIASVHQLLESDEPDLARKTLSGLIARHGNNAETVELDHRVRSTQRREALLDRLHADPRDQDLGYIERLMAALDGAHPDVLAEPRTGVARALFYAYGGDQAAARTALTPGGVARAYPRFCTAMRAHLDGRDPGSAVAALQAESEADDHTLASAVFRMAESGSDVIEAELRRALAVDPLHTRARFGLAVVHFNRGDAERAMDVLDEPGSRSRPDSLVLLAYCALRLGRPEIAASRIADARALLHAADRPPMLRLDRVELYTALFAGDLVRFDELWAAAHARWGEVAHLHLLAAKAATVRGRDSAARRSFELAAELAHHPTVARQASIALLQLDNAEFHEGGPNGDGLSSAALRQRAEELRDRARNAGDARVESDALFVLYDLLSSSGEAAAAWSALQDALRAEPHNPDVAHVFVGTVYGRVAQAQAAPLDQAAAIALGSDVRLARDCCDGVSRRAQRDALYMAPSDELTMLLAGIGLAVDAKDEPAAKRWLARARELVNRHSLDDMRPTLAQFAALVR